MLHFVTGKGGVGKSTIAAALARAAAARGARVLAIELGEPAGLARAFGAPPRDAGEIARVGDVHVAWFEGAAALAEYVTRKLRLGRIGRRILAHPLYHAFVAAAPGLRELLVVGKVRDEYVLQRRWDVVVVDAGASGHALEHLRMPASAAGTFGSGLVHREARVNAELLRDARQCAVHVVALPEAMPLGEAVQTVDTLRALGVTAGRVVINRCLPPAPVDIESALAAIVDPVVAPILAAACERERIQERGIAALEARLAVAALRLPRLPLAELAEHATALAPFVAELAA